MKALFNLSKIFLIILILFSTYTITTFAGGGRFSISAPEGSGWTTTYINVNAYVTYNDTASVGEKVEFRIRNPRSGDRCETYGNGTSGAGWVGGTCYATQAGTVTIYVYSLDKGDESSNYLIYFYEPSPTPTQKPTATPTQIPTSTPKPTNTITPSPTIIKLLSIKKPTITIAPTQKPTIISTTNNTFPENNNLSAVNTKSVKNNSSGNIWLAISIITGFLVITLGGALSIMYLKKTLEN